MLKIDNLDHYGRGITKLDNKIIFIENSLPGEIIEINIIKEKNRFIEANVKKYIKTSDKRIDSECPYYHFCGGCNLLHTTYVNELDFKKNKIKNIVKKYIKDDIKINNTVYANNRFNYRNKITFQVKNNVIGFFKPNSNEIIKINTCLLAHPLINNSIKYLNMLDLTTIDKIICRTASNKLMIIIESKNKNINIDSIKKIAHSVYIKYNNTYNLIYGEKNLIECIGHFKFLISPDSFFQVNLEVCTKLYTKIKENINKDDIILDLYCGTGTIGIFINNNKPSLGIEINKSAINDAIENKKINNIKNMEFLCGKSEDTINDINIKPTVIILDPPRAGLGRNIITEILNIKPPKIIYISCDPMTLARDLNLLKEEYDIKEITPFDMFPNTYHVECISVLHQKNIQK